MSIPVSQHGSLPIILYVEVEVRLHMLLNIYAVSLYSSHVFIAAMLFIDIEEEGETIA